MGVSLEPDLEVVAQAGDGSADEKPRDRCRAYFSYRHDDNQILVQSVWRHLQDALPGWTIFLDLDGLELGASMRQTFADRIQQATVVFAFVGPKWEGQPDRISAEDDWVRTELQVAFDAKKWTIPVAHSGHPMPSERTAPPGLAWLFDRAGVTIDNSHGSLLLAVDRMRQILMQKVQDEDIRLRDFMKSQPIEQPAPTGPLLLTIEPPAPARLQPKPAWTAG